MFIVNDDSVAQIICNFYENPDHVGWRDELSRLGLLEKVEKYAETVKNLTLDDFIKNERWVGISQEMDAYLPSCRNRGDILGGRTVLSRGYALRTVNISSNQPLEKVTVNAGELPWFTTHVRYSTYGVVTPDYISSHQLNYHTILKINSCMLTGMLLYNEISLKTNIHPTEVWTMTTHLPWHIYDQLKQMEQVIVPSQGKDYYIVDKCLETI